MDNKFVVLDKSKENLERLQKFILNIENSDENKDSLYRIVTYDFKIKKYGEYWGLESEFRNTVLSDLEHWLIEKEMVDIVKDSLVVIWYNYDDYATLYKIVGDDYGESLFDVFDGTLCKEGYKYKNLLPMNNLLEYFCK